VPSRATDLSTLLDNLAATHGDRPAVADVGTTLTFAALHQAAGTWGMALRTAGFGPGARVGLLAGNGPEWLAVAFGVWRAGATLVPISTFVTARELHEILTHADVDILVVQARLRTHDYLGMLHEIPRLPTLRRVIVLGEAPGGGEPAQQFLGTIATSHPGPISIDRETIACLLYTSGTTGAPKGVQLSHRAILATVMPTATRSGLTSSDALVSTLPLFWVAGLVIRALPTLAAGCTLIVLETFTTDALIVALEQARPTALHLRPPQVGQLLGHPKFQPELLAAVRKGGGRAEWYAPHLGEARLITGYGMTEMSGYVTALDWHDPRQLSSTPLGTALPGVELCIVDDAGRPSAAGEVGAIRVRGPGLFSGYHKQPAGAGLDDAGFFMTGDLGNIDAAGVFHFVGRTKDLLRVKGINVSPAEVEQVLATHPRVEAAYVVGIPFDTMEQDLVALIVPKPGEAPTDASLRAHAADALSHYKRPQDYLFIARHDVTFNATSKPQRAALVELAVRLRKPRAT